MIGVRERSSSRALKQVAILALAIFLAFVSMGLFTIWRLETLWRGNGAQVASVIRCGYQWFVAQDEVFGAHWVNLQPAAALRSKDLVDGDLPRWAEPTSAPQNDEPLRIGKLAIGWPSPWILWTFESSGPKALFPPFAELDDQDTSLPNACEVVREVRPGPTPTWRLLSTGFFIAAIALTMVYRLSIELILRKLRSHSAGSIGSST
ncbi:MAG: hypothetical protein EXS10_03220 [Phycisphaerales bacterium]|nr:hypothetical protein [Phycisphaerales bacterium]